MSLPELGKRRMGDQAIRVSMTVTVLGVAIVAAWVSYWHEVEVIRRYGAEQEPAVYLIPLTIDGMIYASSMAKLWCARYQLKTGWLARIALVLGIAATLAANVLQGLEYGPVAAVIAAWPAVALVISYELLMWVVRAGRAIADDQTAEVDPVEETGPAELVPPAPEPPHDVHAFGFEEEPATGNPSADETGGPDRDAAADLVAVPEPALSSVGKQVGKEMGKSDQKLARFQERLAQAREIDAAHRAAKGRPISAENLAAELKCGKRLALDLVKVVRAEFAQDLTSMGKGLSA